MKRRVCLKPNHRRNPVYICCNKNGGVSMRTRILASVFIFVLLPGLVRAQGNKSSCDRACLEKYVDRYMDAMLNHDPSLELFSRDCKFTENGVRLPLGHEGLWFGMSGKGSYKFYVPDVETQQVAFLGTAREGKANKQGEIPLVAVAVRLKILNGLIAEAEQLVLRSDSDTMGMTGQLSVGASVEKRGKPHEIYREAIPEAERLSREELIKAANYYFSGMQKNDGKGYYPYRKRQNAQD
jgi:hypothetical protein